MDQLDVKKLQTVPADEAAKIKASVAVPPGFLSLAAAADLLPKVSKPGVERWPVKTGTDQDVAKVGQNNVSGQDLGAGIVDTTVEELVNIPRPSDMTPPGMAFPAFQDRRSEATETTIWRLTADIIAIKVEADGDYHLVLQGESGDTMVGEVPNPDPAFVDPSSPFADNIATARAAVDAFLGNLPPMNFVLPAGQFMMPSAALAPSAAQPAGMQPAAQPANPMSTESAPGGLPVAFKTKVRGRAVITGVGFFDRVHNQTGVAMLNGIELHPILQIDFQN